MYIRLFSSLALYGEFNDLFPFLYHGSGPQHMGSSTLTMDLQIGDAPVVTGWIIMTSLSPLQWVLCRFISMISWN